MFTKGQRVNLVRNYNGKGEVSITPAIVYSCGKKQMVLTHAETGEELGRNFKPAREQYQRALVLTVDENAEEIAMELATAIRLDFIGSETNLINSSNGSSEYWNKRRVVLAAVIASQASVTRR